MRRYIVFLLLLAVKLAGRVFFRVRLEWVRESEDPWSDLRVLALLNHTSLFEPVLATAAPFRLLWQIAAHGVIPVADKTVARPFVGRFFRFMAQHVVPVTRERDDTWSELLSRIEDPKGLVVILPEGRMKRRTGLDLEGNEMTVRGGIADILEGITVGKMFVVYSEGLHHVHAPGDRLPRLFQRVVVRGEILDISDYKAELERNSEDGVFKHAVIEDLTRRRDLYCRHDGSSAPGPSSDQNGRDPGARDGEDGKRDGEAGEQDAEVFLTESVPD